jgi:predicted ArsR family transcriptional regulator
VLPTHPMLSVDTAAAIAGVSSTAARTALEVLAERGIVAEQPAARGVPGRPRRWWLARALVDLVGGWAG